MMHKIVSELIVQACANWCTWRTKKKQSTESTDAVLAKVWKLEIFMYLGGKEVWYLYSGVELTKTPLNTGSFHVEEIWS